MGDMALGADPGLAHHSRSRPVSSDDPALMIPQQDRPSMAPVDRSVSIVSDQQPFLLAQHLIVKAVSRTGHDSLDAPLRLVESIGDDHVAETRAASDREHEVAMGERRLHRIVDDLESFRTQPHESHDSPDQADEGQ